MNLSKKLCLSILGLLLLIGALFFVGEKYFFQRQDKAPISLNSQSVAQNIPILIQEAKQLLGEGYKTSDSKLVHQAIDKYTIWLENNWNNPDKKLIDGILVVRANAFLWLKRPHEAIHDFKKTIEYNPNGVIQSGICLLEKQQGNLSVLHDCYVKAVEYFKSKKVSRTNLDFLLARILSGDKSAISEYKNILQTSTGDEKWLYEEGAKMLLDKETYKEITGKDCEDCGNFRFIE